MIFISLPTDCGNWYGQHGETRL